MTSNQSFFFFTRSTAKLCQDGQRQSGSQSAKSRHRIGNHYRPWYPPCRRNSRCSEDPDIVSDRRLWAIRDVHGGQSICGHRPHMCSSLLLVDVDQRNRFCLRGVLPVRSRGAHVVRDRPLLSSGLDGSPWCLDKLRVPPAHTSLEIRRKFSNMGHVVFTVLNLIKSLFFCLAGSWSWG